MYSSYKETRDALQAGEVTCVELVKHYLKNIASQKNLNVFLETFDTEALSRAKEIDQKIKSGTAGKLAGMVIGLKDVICYKDHSLQASSKILDGFVSKFSSTAVEKALAEDAIIIGRQNCDEFAMGSSNENSAFGPTINPHGDNLVPGGSSGASAVAVAANMCLVSLGSDTGGSVRQPAAFCGVVGTKPTYSRISRHGLIAYASSFDTIGILSHTTEDAALVLEVIAGKDDFDATVSQKDVPAYSKVTNTGKKWKIGYSKESIESKGLHPEIKERMETTINQLKDAGHEVTMFDFPLLDYVLPTYYILTTAEASTNLSRFDGVRYGYRTPSATALEEMYKKSRSEGFGEEVKRRIMLGTFVLSASYYDAYFTKAQKVRKLIKEKTSELFEEYDFIVLPTTPAPPFKIGAYSKESVVDYYLADLFTVQANVAGIPAISIPAGKSSDNLPIGLQVMSEAFSEEKLFEFAASLEKDLAQSYNVTE
ncbi:Asp-tRNA(Asn)/Glu-tRNA(Gln) amidotransferase subunit GatA [Chondrinema litorale]|uniref:Asp-tRNA(Asn)/Glu-tRNA(Gln) amidotransferase subunit GatA n=1 Tax=Chondrinema litorale TaxID=2994555 RepID=UPI00254376CB|nr:Asp-tRNA(Asn)/Glu-tRNA(Gln) amidotransferase subunit GatA [Chondrinema litorale]UZR92900.1 Asp-tRNA(Asn)/Glu-tRNA(Gln) amidotransferase subunit GatA [Chondrinema litorale]